MQVRSVKTLVHAQQTWRRPHKLCAGHNYRRISVTTRNNLMTRPIALRILGSECVFIQFVRAQTHGKKFASSVVAQHNSLVRTEKYNLIQLNRTSPKRHRATHAHVDMLDGCWPKWLAFFIFFVCAVCCVLRQVATAYESLVQSERNITTTIIHPFGWTCETYVCNLCIILIAMSGELRIHMFACTYRTNTPIY